MGDKNFFNKLFVRRPVVLPNRHQCKLDEFQLHPSELPGVAPYASDVLKRHHRFKDLIVVSRWNPQSESHFRSRCATFKEIYRQLHNKSYRYMIHPFSKFAFFRQCCVCIIWLTVFITDPLSATFLTPYVKKTEDTSIIYIQIVLNILLLYDVVTQFFTGYVDNKSKQIVLDKGCIVKRYLLTYFIIDAVPVCYDLITFFMKIPVIQESLGFTERHTILLTLPHLYCLRFMRLGTMTQFFMDILFFFKLSETTVKCSGIVLVTMILIHWGACYIYGISATALYFGSKLNKSGVGRISIASDQPLDSIYIQLILVAMAHFLGAGKANITSKNPLEWMTVTVVLMCGMIWTIIATAYVLQLFGTINQSESKYDEMLFQLEEYMMTKKLPTSLQKRLVMYYEYKYQKRFFRAQTILNMLSDHLKYEVTLYSCANLINKVRVLHGASKEVVGCLVAMFKHEIFLPDEIIVKTDGLNEYIYFISYGTVAIYNEDGMELCHLEDGHHFGEFPFVLGTELEELHNHTIVAVEITEVFYLHKTDYYYIAARHPEIAEVMTKAAVLKITHYREMKLMSSYANDRSDIIAALRTHGILDRGRKQTFSIKS